MIVCAYNALKLLYRFHIFPGPAVSVPEGKHCLDLFRQGGYCPAHSHAVGKLLFFVCSPDVTLSQSLIYLEQLLVDCCAHVKIF